MGRAHTVEPVETELRGTLAADRLDYISELIDAALTHAHDGHLSTALEEVTAARRRLQGVEQLIKSGKR